MAAATGNIVIALAGGSFDSATYPRFVLNDGTNSLTFVIDNNAASLSLDGSQFEDNRPGELHVPTLDEADGARKARIAMSFHFYFLLILFMSCIFFLGPSHRDVFCGARRAAVRYHNRRQGVRRCARDAISA